jgi:predicted nucleotidyltransferase component of viral defense system
VSTNVSRFKARIRNLAQEKKLPAQALLQNYLFECFLERLAESPYRDKFILKGGMLVAALIGLDARSTMDLDTTIRNLPLTEESIRGALTAICLMPVDDDVVFQVGPVKPIRSDDIYGGYRASLTATLGVIEAPLTIDITTGDVITPGPQKTTIKRMLDARTIELWAYNVETILAEKIETILRRNVFNTRPRDYYDVYIFHATKGCDVTLLREALTATAAHRGTTEEISDHHGILTALDESAALREMWRKYQREFHYAKDVPFDAALGALRDMLKKIVALDGG